MLTLPSRLISRHHCSPTVALLRFSTESQPDFRFEPGQYVIVHIPQPDGPPARRLYSIASPPQDLPAIDLVVELVPDGVGSSYLNSVKENDQVTLQGPAGRFTYQEKEENIVFLATGTGIAPIRCMIHAILQKNPDKQITLFWGLKTYQDIYFLDELKSLAQAHPAFSFTIAVSRPGEGGVHENPDPAHVVTGRVTVPLAAYLDSHPGPTQFSICGGRQAVEGLRAFLEENGVPKEQVDFEKF